MCVRSSAIRSAPGRVSTRSAIWFAIVAVGRKSAASCPSSSAARRCSSFTVGSSRSCSSPTSAAAIAARISGVGRVAVSERRSITLGRYRRASYIPARPGERGRASHDGEERMRKRLGLLLACACFFAVPVGAHAATVTSLANVTADDHRDNEVDIAVNPKNPNNLIAGWNDYGPGGSCGVGYSTNGGKTWHTDWLRGMTVEGGNPTYDYGAGDPSVGFTNDRTAVFICNAWSQKKPTALYSTTSADGGGTG